MNKKELRSTYSERRQKLSGIQKDAQSLSIANNCLRLPVWDHQFYHLFLSISNKSEVDTGFLLTVLQGKDKHVVVPKITGPGELTHYLLTEDTRLKENSWGVPEPVSGRAIDPLKLDVVFLPLLAFDELGHRVGYGGGYYDRFLAKCRGDAIKIGLSFFGPEPVIGDLHAGDVRMDFCITPTDVYSF